MHRHPSVAPIRRALPIFVVLVLAVAACGGTPSSPSTGPSAPASAAPSASPNATASAPVAGPSGGPSPSAAASPSQDADAMYDQIEQQVVEIRGLQPTRDVQRAILSEAELKASLAAQFAQDNPPEYVAGTERLYRALGLMPEDTDLKTLYLDLLGSSVAGFYRPDEQKMYVVSRSGEIGADEKTTYAHEFTHALQDMHFPIFKEQEDVLDRSDWILARAAGYEGDATVLMSVWAQTHLSPTEMGQLGQVDPADQATIDAMPAILREPLLFPYTTGAFFVLAQQMQGGWPSVDEMLGRLPESTEQVLHAEKYAANERPVEVALPNLAKRLGKGWSTPLQDTFGELQASIWLADSGVDPAVATDAAAGWGGDRLAVLEGPKGAWAVAMRWVWDTPADAKAFATAAEGALGTVAGSSKVLPGAGGKERWVIVADSAKTLDKVANVAGLAG